MRRRPAAIALVTLGIAIIAFGLANNRTFLYAGVPFLLLGLVMLLRR